MGVGKLGSMYGELTSISNMESDRDSNLRPNNHQAQTLTTAPSCYLRSSVIYYAYIGVVPPHLVMPRATCCVTSRESNTNAGKINQT